jgi:hypothetical protein
MSLLITPVAVFVGNGCHVIRQLGWELINFNDGNAHTTILEQGALLARELQRMATAALQHRR